MARAIRALTVGVATLWAVAAAIFLVGLLVGFVVVGRHGGGPIQGVDDTVGRWFLQHRGPFVGVSKLIATYLDAGPLAVISALISLVMFIRIRSVVAAVPLIAYLGGEFEVFAIRTVIHRARPLTANFPHPGAVPGVHETSYSFPSGHAVAVTAVLMALATLIATTRHVIWPYVLAGAAALIVVDSRLVLGVHWLSDVVFGVVAGVVWGVVVTRVVCKVNARL